VAYSKNYPNICLEGTLDIRVCPSGTSVSGPRFEPSIYQVLVYRDPVGWSRVVLRRCCNRSVSQEIFSLFDFESSLTRHWPLSYARLVQSIPSHPDSLRYVLLLSSQVTLILPRDFPIRLSN
jgi:hypothetical protein